MVGQRLHAYDPEQSPLYHGPSTIDKYRLTPDIFFCNDAIRLENAQINGKLKGNEFLKNSLKVIN